MLTSPRVRLGRRVRAVCIPVAVTCVCAVCIAVTCNMCVCVHVSFLLCFMMSRSCNDFCLYGWQTIAQSQQLQQQLCALIVCAL